MAEMGGGGVWFETIFQSSIKEPENSSKLKLSNLFVLYKLYFSMLHFFFGCNIAGGPTS